MTDRTREWMEAIGACKWPTGEYVWSTDDGKYITEEIATKIYTHSLDMARSSYRQGYIEGGIAMAQALEDRLPYAKANWCEEKLFKED